MNITLGVTGSISAYKSIELLRLLIKEDHEVKVVLTKGALKFVRPELFSYLGASDVFSPEDDFSFPHKSTTALAGNVLHVELAKWSEKLVIAPLSANSLSNLINANAGDLLSSLFLAWEKQKPILVFPAMNTHMYHHPFVQKNLRQLGELENLFLGPTQVGELACGDTGEGKLLETDKIFQLIKSLNPCLSDKHNSTKFLPKPSKNRLPHTPTTTRLYLSQGFHGLPPNQPVLEKFGTHLHEL
jgi:phosphopantothenoylcysteine decarboxylase/phosphopantothenate--cysteine ligase